MRIELKSENDELNTSVTDGYITPVTDLSSGSEKAKNPMKGMTFLQKLSYIGTYYAPKILFIVLLLGLTFSFLLVFLLHKTPKVNILFVNHYRMEVDDATASLEKYMADMGYSSSDKININATVNMDLSNFATYEEKNEFDALIAGKDYTLLFADEEVFTACAESGYFLPLSEVAPSELISKYDDELIEGYDEEYDFRYTCGIHLTKETCPWLNNTNYEECFVGALYSNSTAEDTAALLSYILSYDND